MERQRKSKITQDEIGESAHMASHYIRCRRTEFKEKDDERRLEAGEILYYRRMLRISWTENRTNKSILDELQRRRELLAHVMDRDGSSGMFHECSLIINMLLRFNFSL